jgi:uncharacterized protein
MESFSQSMVDFRNRKRMLVIMAKAPRPGMVKTRLSPSLPSRAVTALYRCLLQDTIALAKSLHGVEVAIMCPAPDTAALKRLVGNALQVRAQKGEGLAAGLASVFTDFAATGQDVIAFNADSPHLSGSVLEGAFQALALHDVVIGPTYDGGYYLVGAKAVHPTLFENDGLGTRSALERLLTRARVLQLSTRLTEPFYDIDVAEDLIRLAGELQLEPARAPRTAAWFADWGQIVAKLVRHTGKL